MSVENNNENEESMDLDDTYTIEGISHFIAQNRSSNVRQQSGGLEDTKGDPVATTCESDGIVGQASVLYVVDTNFLMSHLTILSDLVAYYPNFRNLLVFPLTVIQELDGLKNVTQSPSDGLQSRYQPDIGLLARRANDWLFKAFARSEPAIRGQKASEEIGKGLVGDKSILGCCRFFQEMQHKPVVLLSNDKNLCVQALIYSIRTVSFVPGLTAREILIRSLDLPQDTILPSTGSLSPIMGHGQVEQPPRQDVWESVDATMEDADASMDVDEPPPDLKSSKHTSRRAVTDHRGTFWFPRPDLKP
ncbi:PIN domain-containing protein [Lipomyces kononenkoae]|uniref:PIN domain-containing protein n=1 Tax=Lipomyces kononenkoae TaxID=34357 RepID=A0ACC3SWW2_LIPKO